VYHNEILIFFWGATTNLVARVPIIEVYRSHTHTEVIGLLCTSDQPVADTATYTTQQTREMNTHALSGIRTLSATNLVAADLRLRMRGHLGHVRVILTAITTQLCH